MLTVQSRGLRDDTFLVRALKGTSGRGGLNGLWEASLLVLGFHLSLFFFPLW